MPTKKRVSVDKEEYQALCDLRDGEHAREQLRAIAFEENYKAALAVNQLQCTRLANQELLLTDLHSKIERFQRELALLEPDRGAADKLTAMEKKLADMQHELDYYKPATSTVAQPAFGRRT